MPNTFVHVHMVALRYFSETVRAGSMRQAAEHLSVAASAINRQIMKLEDQLQCRLFERRAEGVRLTAAGEVLYHYVRRLEHELERAIIQIDDLRGLRRGHVSIDCSAGIGRDFLPQLLAVYHRAYPGVTFSICTTSVSEAMDHLLADSSDIALVMSPTLRPDLRVAASDAVPVGVITAPGSALAPYQELRLQDLIGEQLIRSNASAGGAISWQEQIERAEPRGHLIETNGTDLVTNLVKADLGIGIRSPVGIMGELSQGTIRFVPLRDPLAPNPALTILVRAQRILSPAAAILLEMLKDALPVFCAKVWEISGQPLPAPQAQQSAARGPGND
jgi:DNA-binding transcriptional LysR family regulator